jgi:5'-methylthioadenosine phosphorylase
LASAAPSAWHGEKERKIMAEELIGVIGGTGLGDALAEHITDVEFHDIDTPFGRPSTAILVGRIGQKRIAFLNRHGKGHKLSPSEVPFAANIFALKKLGVHTVIEMAEPACQRVRKIFIDTAKEINIKTHPEGTYVCMEGPQFSTRAESLMHRRWGGDLIGMTAMPEAKLAREAQICYALIGLASDYDCWKPHEAQKNKQTLLKEIIGNLQAATSNCLELIKAVLTSERELVCEDCHCRNSLDLAVWTDQGQIKMADKERLKVLFE